MISSRMRTSSSPKITTRRVHLRGGGAHLLHNITQDANLFVEKSPTNGRALVAALKELGFPLAPKHAAEIEGGKDFVQLRYGPFDLDLVFAAGGIETFDEAERRALTVEGIPVCHIDDIIRSKEATGRVKDRESLPRLKAFRDWWMNQQRPSQAPP